MTLICLVTAALAAFIFWRMESWPMRTAHQTSAELERLGGDMRDAFVDVLQVQPRVTINNRVYFEKTTALAELAVLSRTTEVEHEFEHTWVGSTKRVKLHATFNIKVGFDLRENVAVDVTDDEIAVQIPHAKILGVEQENVDVLEYENGLWNRISAEDLQSELAALPKLAREKAEQSNLIAEAETALQKQLEERIGTAKPLRLNFGLTSPDKP
ncbi:MAG: DUF4230 domain-containing protein [Chthoniobacterales bacterium]